MLTVGMDEILVFVLLLQLCALQASVHLYHKYSIPESNLPWAQLFW